MYSHHLVFSLFCFLSLRLLFFLKAFIHPNIVVRWCKLILTLVWCFCACPFSFILTLVVWFGAKEVDPFTSPGLHRFQAQRRWVCLRNNFFMSAEKNVLCRSLWALISINVGIVTGLFSLCCIRGHETTQGVGKLPHSWIDANLSIMYDERLI